MRLMFSGSSNFSDLLVQSSSFSKLLVQAAGFSNFLRQAASFSSLLVQAAVQPFRCPSLPRKRNRLDVKEARLPVLTQCTRGGFQWPIPTATPCHAHAGLKALTKVTAPFHRGGRCMRLAA